MTIQEQFGEGIVTRAVVFVVTTAFATLPFWFAVDASEGRAPGIIAVGAVGLIGGHLLAYLAVRWLVARLERAATQRGRNPSRTFRALHAMETALSALAMIGLGIGFYFGVSLGAIGLWDLTSPLGVAASVASIVLAFVLIGMALEVVLARVLLANMQRQSGSLLRDDDDAVAPPSTTGSHGIDLRVGPVSGGDQHPKLPSPVERRLTVHRRHARLLWLGAPAAATAVAIGVGVVVDVPVIEFAAWLVGLVAAALLVAAGLRELRHVSPLRQLKLLFDTFAGFTGLGMAGLGLVVSFGIYRGPRGEVWDIVDVTVETMRQIVVSRHLLVASAAFAAGLVVSENSGATAAVLTAFLMIYVLALVLADVWRGRIGLSRPMALIYLRVFGDPARSGFLVRLLEPRWRAVGPTVCIAGPDVAAHVVDPDDIVDIAFGRFRNRFVGSADDQSADDWLSEASTTDRQGVRQIYCHDDTWKPTLHHVLAQPDVVVLMDLRGFGEGNLGCRYEIGTLLREFPLESLLFVVDDSTDIALLDSTLAEAATTIPPGSPNAGSPALEVRAAMLDEATRATAADLTSMLMSTSGSGHHESDRG